MSNLSEFRSIYPEYDYMTDFEFSTSLHQQRYANVPYEEFAKSFGAPLEEDKFEIAARDYNARNAQYPEFTPITAEQIRQNDRSGLASLLAIPEGFWDATTDYLPMQLAQIFRSGDIKAPEDRSWADNAAQSIIDQQRKDISLRVPTVQEVTGEGWYDDIYQGTQSVPLSLGTMLTGAVAGASVGAPAVGAGAVSGAAFYRLGKDSFMQDIQDEARRIRNRELTAEEVSRLDKAYDDAATESGLWEAGPEAVGNLIGFGLVSGRLGKTVSSILGDSGLKNIMAKIGAKWFTRVPAKAATGVASELATEGVTFMGQGNVAQEVGLRQTAPTVGEFISEQAGAVTAGTLMQMLLGGGFVKGYNALTRNNTPGANNDNVQFEEEDTSDVPQENVSPQQQSIDGSSLFALPQGSDPGVIPMASTPYNQSALESQGFFKELPEGQSIPLGAVAEKAPLGTIPMSENIDLLSIEGRSTLATSESPAISTSIPMSERPDPLQVITPYPVDAPQQSLQGASLLGLPRGDGSIPMGSNNAGLGTISPPTIETGLGVVAPDYIPRPALPQGTGEPPFSTPWAGRRSQLSYPWGTGAQTITPYPVDAIPTQAQITSTQEAPRADTMGMSAALGLDPVSPIPQEQQAVANTPVMQVPATPVNSTSTMAPSQVASVPESFTPQLQDLEKIPTGSSERKQLRENALKRLQNNVLEEDDVDYLTQQELLSGLSPENKVLVRGKPKQKLRDALKSQLRTQKNEKSQEELVREEPQETGLQPDERGTSERPIVSVDEGDTVATSENLGQSSQKRQEGGQDRRRTAIKIPNRNDEPVTYELVNADDIQASHDASQGFVKNSKYGLENERLYHREDASKQKVLTNAAQLDPAFLQEAVDANHGAPIVDKENNVLGGNGRAMSIKYAYDGDTQKAKEYREAILRKANELGIETPSLTMEEMSQFKPVLVRRIDRDMSKEERQELVSAMNDTFTDSKNKRASGKSRGDRISSQTLRIIAKGMQDGDFGTLRSYFSDNASIEAVDSLFDDNAFQQADRNALIGVDGLFNPDGKNAIEEALLGRLSKDYDSLSRLPETIKSKLDGSIPHILIAENIKGWSVTTPISEAIELASKFTKADTKDINVFLSQGNILNGKNLIDEYSPEAVHVFRMLQEMKKNEFVKALERYAGYAKISQETNSLPGIGKSQKKALRELFETNKTENFKQKEQDHVDVSRAGAQVNSTGDGRKSPQDVPRTLEDEPAGQGTGREGRALLGNTEYGNGEGSISTSSAEQGDGSPRSSSNTDGDTQQIIQGSTGSSDGVSRGAGTNAGGNSRAGNIAKKNSSNGDYIAPEGSLTREGSWRDTANRNLDIIELAKTLTKENRRATPEEQALLVKYTGFGASEIRNSLFPSSVTAKDYNASYAKSGWVDIAQRLKDLLTPQEIDSIMKSTQYAHYTSEGVIRSIWKGLERMGFKGGNILEPGMGVGLFATAAPKNIIQKSKYTGIEMDSVTAEIAGHILPDSNIIAGDYTVKKFPNNFFDIAIGNPPFADITVLKDPTYKKYRLSLHDYFFAKSLDKVRPGGLMVFVTSRYTMDKMNDKARSLMSEKADLIGAIRLPQTAFKQNAGTEVVTDILFFRKRKEGEVPTSTDWLQLENAGIEGQAISINKYFVDNPSMVLGKNATEGSLYSKNEYTVLPPEGDIEQLISQAIESLPTQIMGATSSANDVLQKQVIERDFNPVHKKEGGIYVDDQGVLRKVEDGTGVELQGLSDKQKKWLKSYVSLRDSLKQAQFDQLNDNNWEQSLADLNKEYDAFVKEYGRISAFTERESYSALIQQDDDTFKKKVIKKADVSKYDDDKVTLNLSRNFKNISLLKQDIEYSLVMSLEKTNEAGEIEKGPFLLGRTIKKPAKVEIKNTNDALMVTLNDKGRLDIEHLAELAGESKESVIKELGDLIYQVPGGDWVMGDEYLSGDVVTKLEEAEAAAKTNSQYERNVTALLEVQPKPIKAENINADLGSVWIPIEYVQEFANVEIGIPLTSARKIKYQEELGVFSIPNTGLKSVTLGTEYGTSRRNPQDIFDSAINNKKIKIFDYDTDKKAVLNEAETALVNEKVKEIREAFALWVWSDKARAENLMKIYNRKYNNIAPRKFNGSHLTLPGLSLKYKLFEHQKRAIWRIIQEGNTYLAHAVGAGKTLEMIVSAMEQKRLGLINRPMFIVPNSMLAQFSNEFLDAYPLANIMVADESNFDKENRNRFIAQASINNPDAVIMTHSSFGKIGLKEETLNATVEEFIEQLEHAIKNVDGKDQQAKITRTRLEKRKERLEQQIAQKIKDQNKQSPVFFEDMGIDFLYVDEAHEFRKLDFVTHRDAVKGISPEGSRRSLDLLTKINFLRSKNPTRSLVMASGTPITNTIAEMYTVMRYMAPQSLEADGLYNFDSWASLYGRSKSDLEPNASGKQEYVERFSKFVNVPQMMKRVREFMDVLSMQQLGDYVSRPSVAGGGAQTVISEISEEQDYYLKVELAKRIEESKKWRRSKEQPGNPDPIINIITDGKLAALDMRFIDKSYADNPDGKVNTMINSIVDTYNATKDAEYTNSDGEIEAIKGSTQIVFSFQGFGESVSKRFNLREDITKKLVSKGIKASEIAWMSDYTTTAQKGNLFTNMRAGKVRVLFGSPKNMGTGVNVQKRLIKLHYLSPPWYPSDVEQPHGRIIRQGNQNPEIEISWYATKGTYDSAMWGMISRKSKFIEQAMSGDDDQHTIDDISESSYYEQAAAISSGDERILQLASLNLEVEHLERLKRAHENDQRNYKRNLRAEQARKPALEQNLKKLLQAKERVQEAKKKDGNIHVDGKVYKEMSDTATAFDAKIKSELEAFGNNNTNLDAVKPKTVVVGNLFNKFPIKITFSYVKNVSKGDLGTKKLVRQKNAGELVLDLGDDVVEVITSDYTGEGLTPRGYLSRIMSKATGIDGRIGQAQDVIEQNQKNIKKLESLIGLDFPSQGKLAQAIADVNTLKSELAKDGVQTNEGAVETTDYENDAYIDVEGTKVKDDSGKELLSFKQGEFLLGTSQQKQKGSLTSRIKSRINSLSQAMSGASPVIVVDNFNQLPQGLQESLGQGMSDKVEGVYDPSTGNIYLVENNIVSVERAEEVFLHEQMHKGLRYLFKSPNAMKVFLRQLFVSSGGMGNKEINAIAHKYGLKPMSNDGDMVTVMEEYVASMGEKYKADTVTKEQQGFIRKIITAIKNYLSRLLGRNVKSLDVAGLVKVIGGNLMNGDAVTIDQLLAGGEYVLPSLREKAPPKKTKKMYKLFRVNKRHPGQLFPLYVDANNSLVLDTWYDADIGETAPSTKTGTPKVKSKLGGLAMRPGWHGATLPVATHIGNFIDPSDRNKGRYRPNDQVWAEIEVSADVDWQAEATRRGINPKTGKVNATKAAITDQIPEDGYYLFTTNTNAEGKGKWVIAGSIKVNRILTDDEVKQINKDAGNIADLERLEPLDIDKLGFYTSLDKPLASLRDITPSALLEAGARKIMKVAEAPEVKHYMDKDDLSRTSRIVSLPHWIAKKSPEFAKVYERQLERSDQRAAAVKESLEAVPSLFGSERLKKADRDSLTNLIWDFEGKQIKVLEGVSKFVKDNTLENGRDTIKTNPKFYTAYKSWLDSLDSKKYTKAAKDSMLEVRMSLDNDLALAHNKMAEMSEINSNTIDEYRQRINHVPNYFPHHRYGKYYVQVKDDEGTVIFRQHYDAANKTIAKVMAEKIASENRDKYAGKWYSGVNEKLPDEILGAPIDSEAMEQIIRASTKNIDNADDRKKVEAMLYEGTSEVLKTRGWGAHGIRRKGVPGFEKQDIEKVLYDYKSGLNGWLTKIAASRDFSKALSKIDARKSPRLWEYTSQYVKDMLRNFDNIDRTVGNIKSVAFAWYLGGSIKTAMLNLTQNIIIGVPRLQMDVTDGAKEFFVGAQKAIVDRVTGNKGKGLTDEEAKFIAEMYGENVITDAFMEEIRGQLSGITGASLWNKFTRVLGYPMSEVEKFNRASLALAAFRAARKGRMKERAKKKYGVKSQATYEQAKVFASEIVKDSHFVYGRDNMPEFLRSNTAGRMASAMYTFRTFTHNMISLWTWALKTQGKEGAIFIGKSIGATVALGGITAVPFYATAMAIFQAIFDDDDNWTEEIRKALPENNLLRDVTVYGAPAMLGVNLGGSLKMETPLTRGISRGTTPKEILTESVGDLIGIPYDIFVERPTKVVEALDKGSNWKAVEALAPTFVRNAMSAYRLSTEGQTTVSGRPINLPGEKGARKITTAEAVGKSLGFNPLSSQKAYDSYTAIEHSKNVRSEKIDELTILALEAHDTGKVKSLQKMRNLIKEWNLEMQRDGKLHMLIREKDVQRRAKARRRESRMNEKNVIHRERVRQSWGM